MSYVVLPSGFSNPATENLDLNGFDIDDADTINVTTVNGATATGVTIGSNATQKVGFHGATPVIQGSAPTIAPPTPLPPAYDAGLIDAELQALSAQLGAVLALITDVGLAA